MKGKFKINLRIVVNKKGQINIFSTSMQTPWVNLPPELYLSLELAYISKEFKKFYKRKVWKNIKKV